MGIARNDPAFVFLESSVFTQYFHPLVYTDNDGALRKAQGAVRAILPQKAGRVLTNKN